MQRKLIQQGAGGYTIYLPKKWITQQNLQKGALITIDALDGNLTLKARASAPPLETSIILVSHTESAIRTLITNAYRLGYDTIHATFKDEKQYKILQEVVETKLIGVEITSKDKDSCTIENITEPSAERFEVIVQKILYSITEYFRITKLSMEDPTYHSPYKQLASHIQRYDNFCRRALSRERFQSRKSEMLWTFLALIVHAQRELYHLHKLLPEKKPVSAAIIQYIGRVETMYIIIKEAYLGKKPELLDKVHAFHEELSYKEGYDLFEKVKGNELIILHHLLTAERDFYLSNSPLLGWLM